MSRDLKQASKHRSYGIGSPGFQARIEASVPSLVNATSIYFLDLPYSKTFSPATMAVCVVEQSILELSLENKSLDLLFGKKGRTGPHYLKGVLDCVSKERHKIFKFKKPAGATLEIGPLEDTIFSEEPEVVNGWGKFYLPEIVSMQVVGVVEGTSCPWDQLVLMICEDGKLYAYDGEELHLVASSPKQLDEEGISYPGSKTYYEGEAFKDMTKDDWEEVRKGPTGMRLEREHLKLVKDKKAKFMEYLKVTAATKAGPSQKPVTSPQVLVSQ